MHFFTTVGGKSLIDYSIVSDFFFKNITCLRTKPINFLSDHCLVITDISISGTFQKKQLDIKYERKNLSSISLWNNTSPEAYKEALSSPQLKMINTFLTESSPSSSIGVEKANNLLTNIMCRAAKLSLGNKKVKQYKARKSKKWLKDCQKARKLFKQSAKAANKNPTDVSLNEERSEKLKEFKKNCREQQNFGKKEMMN